MALMIMAWGEPIIISASPNPGWSITSAASSRTHCHKHATVRFTLSWNFRWYLKRDTLTFANSVFHLQANQIWGRNKVLGFSLWPAKNVSLALTPSQENYRQVIAIFLPYRQLCTCSLITLQSPTLTLLAFKLFLINTFNSDTNIIEISRSNAVTAVMYKTVTLVSQGWDGGVVPLAPLSLYVSWEWLQPLSHPTTLHR